MLKRPRKPHSGRAKKAKDTVNLSASTRDFALEMIDVDFVAQQNSTVAKN